MSCNRKRDHEQDPLQPRIAVSSFSCCCSWRYEPSSCPVPPRPLEQPSRPRPMPASAASLLTSPAKAPQAGRRAAAHHAARSPKCRCAQSGGTAPRLSRISTPFAGACHIKISSCRAFTCVSDGIASIECLARWHYKKCTTDNVVISLQVRLQEANARAQSFSEIAANNIALLLPLPPVVARTKRLQLDYTGPCTRETIDAKLAVLQAQKVARAHENLAEGSRSNCSAQSSATGRSRRQAFSAPQSAIASFSDIRPWSWS